MSFDPTPPAIDWPGGVHVVWPDGCDGDAIIYWDPPSFSRGGQLIDQAEFMLPVGWMPSVFPGPLGGDANNPIGGSIDDEGVIFPYWSWPWIFGISQSAVYGPSLFGAPFSESTNYHWKGWGLYNYTVFVDGVCIAKTGAAGPGFDGFTEPPYIGSFETSGFGAAPVRQVRIEGPNALEGTHTVCVKAYFEDRPAYGCIHGPPAALDGVEHYSFVRNPDFVLQFRAPYDAPDIFVGEVQAFWPYVRRYLYPTGYSSEGAFGQFGDDVPYLGVEKGDSVWFVVTQISELHAQVVYVFDGPCVTITGCSGPPGGPGLPAVPIHIDHEFEQGDGDDPAELAAGTTVHIDAILEAGEGGDEPGDSSIVSIEAEISTDLE